MGYDMLKFKKDGIENAVYSDFKDMRKGMRIQAYLK